MSYEMKRLPDLYDGDSSIIKTNNIGDFYWDLRDGHRALVIAVPWPSNQRPIWSSWSIDYKNDSGDQWSWNGDENKPTLSPSINWVSVFHGWIEDGVLSDA